MIGRDDDERRRADAIQQQADEPIDFGNLAIIRRRGEPPLQLGRGIVRFVRIVQMNPQEKRRAIPPAKPRERARDDLAAAPFHGPVSILARTPDPKSSVVDLECPIESGSGAFARIENQ